MSESIHSSSELAAIEITQLHQFSEQWFRGTVAQAGAVFSRLRDVWGPTFEMISPDGRLRETGELLATTYREYAAYPHLTICILNLAVHELAPGAVVVARYEERHEDGQSVDHRLCSATLLCPDPSQNRMSWIRIHESYFP